MHHDTAVVHFTAAQAAAVGVLRARLADCNGFVKCATTKMNWQRNCFQKANVVVHFDKRDLLFENEVP